MGEPSPRGARRATAITLIDQPDVVATAARCCRPAEGDALFGWLGGGRAVAHRADCANVAELRRKVAAGAGRELAVVWKPTPVEVEVRVVVNDRLGLLTDIAGVLTQAGADIKASSSHVNGTVATQRYTLLIAPGKVHRLSELLEELVDIRFQIRQR